MSFSSCPECGDTNFYENSYSVRTFDCGFKGQFGTRTARCGGKRKRVIEAPAMDDAAARYRLALLDAAQVADTIAADMVNADESPEFIGRLRQLSSQMRIFAGHAAPASFEDLSRPKPHRRTGTALMTIIRKARPWWFALVANKLSAMQTFCSLWFAFVAAMHRMSVLSNNYCTMTVFFYSIKWGQGKTTHAVGYAKHCGGVLLTNDLDNGTADIYEAALPEGRIVTLEPGQSVRDWAKHFKSVPLVIDFGGFVESRVIEAAKIAHVCVVPLSYQSTADLMPAVKTVTALQPHCDRIVILINNTATEHVAELETVLRSRFPKVGVLIVNHSRYISRIADDGLTVFDIAALGGLERHQLRHILPQIETLYGYLDLHSSTIS